MQEASTEDLEQAAKKQRLDAAEQDWVHVSMQPVCWSCILLLLLVFAMAKCTSCSLGRMLLPGSQLARSSLEADALGLV